MYEPSVGTRRSGRASRRPQLGDYPVKTYLLADLRKASTVDRDLLVAAYRSRPNVNADDIEDDALDVNKGGAVHAKRRDALSQLARYSVPVLQGEVRRLQSLGAASRHVSSAIVPGNTAVFLPTQTEMTHAADVADREGEGTTSPAGEVVSQHLCQVASSPAVELVSSPPCVDEAFSASETDSQQSPRPYQASRASDSDGETMPGVPRKHSNRLDWIGPARTRPIRKAALGPRSYRCLHGDDVVYG